MKQEDKELLLKDLCARLPYGVKGIEANSICLLNTSAHFRSLIKNIEYKIERLGFKPYLFPMSRMTEEQKSFFDNKHIEIDDYLGIIAPFSHVNCEEWDEVFCWLMLIISIIEGL